MGTMRRLALSALAYGKKCLQFNSTSSNVSNWKSLMSTWTQKSIGESNLSAVNQSCNRVMKSDFSSTPIVSSLSWKVSPMFRKFPSLIGIRSHINYWTPLRESRAGMASLEWMHRTGPHMKERPARKPLDGRPQMKGIVIKTLVKKPKKPNSANRKCVLLKLSNGKEKTAYVPGIGHNLQEVAQEHNIVLVEVGRLRDVPGVNLKCVRGKFDLPHVVKQKQQ